MKQEKEAFSKEDTAAVKGIAILLMMYHHCFATTDRFEGYEISFFPLSQKMGVSLSLAMKICVGMFVFLSTYGMTKSMYGTGEKQPSTEETVRAVTMRLIKLLSGYMFVFLLVQLISAFTNPGRISKVYGTGIQFAVHFAVDFLGLADVLGTPTFLATWWYMSVAILLVICMPLLYGLYRKMGIYSALLMLLLPFVIKFPYENIVRYLPVMMLGIFFAEEDVFAWLEGQKPVCAGMENSENRKRFLVGKGCGLLLESALLFLLLYCRNKYGFSLIGIWDSLLPVVVICLAYEFILPLPGIRWCLGFLGKHSMNIFLTHNFFRVFWCRDFIYGLRSAWIVSLALLAVSLLFSAAIEGLKRLVRFPALVRFVLRRAGDAQ